MDIMEKIWMSWKKYVHHGKLSRKRKKIGPGAAKIKNGSARSSLAKTAPKILSFTLQQPQKFKFLGFADEMLQDFGVEFRILPHKTPIKKNQRLS